MATLQKRRIPRRTQKLNNNDTRRLEARVPHDEKELLQRAAALEGTSLTEFVLRSAKERAQEIVAKENNMNLNSEDMKSIVRALNKPQEPNEALINLMKPRATPEIIANDPHLGEY